MSARRGIILDELGLTPVWRLRAAAATTPLPAGASSAEAVGAATSRAAAVAFEPVVAAAVPGMDRGARIALLGWTDLRLAVAGCDACDLHKSRNQTVFGVGDEKADWMLIGEAPGAEEDARGEPFVGQAGQLLEGMIGAIGLSRERNIYITNVLKCRPPGNRNPAPQEVAQCRPHLLRQVRLVQPRLILAMGRFAVQTLLRTEASIASLRGRLHSYEGVPLIVTYHPAYLLRTLADKSKAWEDLCLARQTMQDLLSAATPPH